MIRTAAILLLAIPLVACSAKTETAARKTGMEAAGTEASGSKAAEAQVSPQAGAQAIPVSDSSQALRAFTESGITVFPSPQPLPAIEFVALSGKSSSLADYAGKYVLLNFWATWCPPCRKEMPSIQRLSDTLGGDDFSVYAVSVAEDPATVTSFLKTNPYTFPIFLDPKGANSSMFVGRGIPTTYIVDRQGRAVAGVVGALEWDSEKLLAAFRSLIAQK